MPRIRDEDSFDRKNESRFFFFFFFFLEEIGTNWRKGEFRLGGKRIEKLSMRDYI